MFFLFTVFFLFNSCFVWAQNTTIKEITVLGNKFIKESQIKSAISLRPGEDFSSSRLGSDLKSIYGMGCFSDVSMDVEETTAGLKLIIKVKEKNGIGEIKFSGNKSIWPGTLTEALDIHKGDTCAFDETSIERNKKKIVAVYKEKGFPFAKVEAKTEMKKELINITFIVNEGKKVIIQAIKFSGNKAFSSKLIMNKMGTNVGKRFNEKELNEGVEKVADFYRNEGYILIEISSPLISMDTQSKKAFVDINIREGAQIKVSKIEVRGNSIFQSEDIKNDVSTKEGMKFNQSKFIEDLRALQMKYYERGYILTKIMPLTNIDEENASISIVLDIQEENLVYIEGIKIDGNEKTKDKVIRRELTVKPGEIFNTQKIWRSRQKIYNLGFFEDVEITTEPGSDKDKMILAVIVKEKMSAMMNFGAGYNTVDGFLGYLEYSQTNFRGLGEYLSGKFEIGPKKLNFELGFTEPWLFDTPTSLGVTLFHTTRNLVEYYYKEKRIGGSLTLGRAVTDYDRISCGYKYEGIEVFEVADTASTDVKSQEGTSVTSSISFSYARDTRDNRFDASSGIYFNISNEIAGGIFGGDNNFYRPTLDFSSYYRLLPKWLVLAFHLRAGTVQEYASTTEVPVGERFYIGGADTVRGYYERSLPSGSTGGKSILYANSELRFSIPGTDNMLKLIGFFDIGNAWKEIEVNFDQLKKGVGFGIRVNLPIGALRFDMGYGIDRHMWEPHFSIGQMF